jgi:hypothetical protein
VSTDDSTGQTYGDLRRRLAEVGDPWTIDPVVSDDEPLPTYPLGARTDEEDEVVRQSRVDPDTDVRDIIGDLPPNDPGLSARWREADVPVKQDRRAAPPDREAGEEP